MLGMSKPFEEEKSLTFILTLWQRVKQKHPAANRKHTPDLARASAGRERW
jgi:hypothetical protein